MRWFAALRRSGEIAYVRRRGRRLSLSTCAVFAAEGRERSQVAVTVSKSVGGAVVRNRVKRRIKGALDGFSAPAAALRLVYVAHPAAAGASYERLANDVARSLETLSRTR